MTKDYESKFWSFTKREMLDGLVKLRRGDSSDRKAKLSRGFKEFVDGIGMERVV